jgi:hypothetical protein
LHFKQCDVILQLQLALLQAPQLELVVVAIEYQQLDHDIEIAMFNIEFDQAQLDFLGISHDSHFRWFTSHQQFNRRTHADQGLLRREKMG